MILLLCAVMCQDTNKKMFFIIFKKQDYERDFRLFLQRKNCKQRLIYSSQTTSGVQTPSKL